MHNFRGMEPLDLSKQPPRPPRAEADGIIFLPRSIDKARAYLDGGNRNGYNIPGVTVGMLEPDMKLVLDILAEDDRRLFAH